MKRKGISPSLRWSVFARDAFVCRYCGAQAGQEGVELVVDHVLSVVEGGDNRIDNLVTACQKCNGGKAGRSLKDAPTSAEIIQRIKDRTSTLHEQAEAISAAILAQKAMEQQAVDLKCEAYDVSEVILDQGEKTSITNLCRAYGADLVLEWYRSAYSHGVAERKAIRYVWGCVRNYRKQNGMEDED